MSFGFRHNPGSYTCWISGTSFLVDIPYICGARTENIDFSTKHMQRITFIEPSPSNQSHRISRRKRIRVQCTGEYGQRHCHNDMKSAFQHQNPMTCELTSKPIPVVKISTTLQRALYRLYRWLATRTLCSLFSLVYLVIHPLDEQHLRTKSNM